MGCSSGEIFYEGNTLWCMYDKAGGKPLHQNRESDRENEYEAVVIAPQRERTKVVNDREII